MRVQIFWNLDYFCAGLDLFIWLKENNIVATGSCCNQHSLRFFSFELPIFQIHDKWQKVFYKDKDGSEHEVWFASYGIGPTRTMGALVEIYNDENGIIWPSSVAPFDIHLINFKKDVKESENIYEELKKQGFEVLYDDRQEVQAGEKLSNADLIGIPYRLIVSDKAGEKVELKRRNEKESKLVSLNELKNLLQE